MGIQDALEAAGQPGTTVEFDALTEDEASDVDAEAATPSPIGSPPGSVLAALRARASEVEADTTVDLALPYFKGLLWGRYQAVPMSRIYRTRNNQVLNPLTDAALAADVLGAACLELLVLEDDELEPLTAPGSDFACRYDDDLAAVLGLAPAERTARSVMFALYASSGRAEALIVSHFQSYFQWLTGEEGALEVADSVVGESRTP